MFKDGDYTVKREIDRRTIKRETLVQDKLFTAQFIAGNLIDSMPCLIDELYYTRRFCLEDSQKVFERLN